MGCKMSFLEIFYEKYEPKLAKRSDTFRKIFLYLELLNGEQFTIVETGTARQPDNWQWDGQSTILWDAFVNHYSGVIYSIDNDEKAIEVARTSVSKSVHFIFGDSIQTLKNMDNKIIEQIDLLYLDSYDFDPNNPIPSAFHHLEELAVIYRRLKKGCLIVVDDCFADDLGKHLLIYRFMNSLGISPLFRGYQYGWII